MNLTKGANFFKFFSPLVGDPEELLRAGDTLSLIVLWLLLGLVLDMELSVLSLLDWFRTHTATFVWKGCSTSPSEESSDDSPVNGIERIWLARPEIWKGPRIRDILLVWPVNRNNKDFSSNHVAAQFSSFLNNFIETRILLWVRFTRI